MNVLPITREGGLLAKLRSMFGADAQAEAIGTWMDPACCVEPR